MKISLENTMEISLDQLAKEKGTSKIELIHQAIENYIQDYNDYKELRSALENGQKKLPFSLVRL
ncbi:MAG: hypothetical protein QNJ31_00030 [Candidatus Caenarcaniphilales bacterium]|nr:hypothetical protein [Candidatus Caenarcaniphilales bacterium]